MRLSLVFELLLIFVLLAFAASRVIDSNSKKHLNTHLKASTHKNIKGIHKNRQTTNKYCSCSNQLCNCCREFNIPVVSLQGPGCASLQYLKGDRLAISMSFGDRVLSNTTVSGKKPKPICMQLPGGISKFCGRVYNIGREEDDFKACLGLELRALQEIEASLRLSCFRFGPRGLKVEAPQPLPVVSENNEDDEEEDDDEDEADYLFGDDYTEENDVDSVDYTAFSIFDDDFVGGIFGDDADTDEAVEEVQIPPKKVTTASAVPVSKHTTKPVLTPSKTTSSVITRKPLKSISSKAPITKSTSVQITKLSTTSTTTPEPTTIWTTTRTIMVPVATVASSKKPEYSIGSANLVPANVTTPHATLPSTPQSLQHQSIAAVTAMLQTLPDMTAFNRITSAASLSKQEVSNTTNSTVTSDKVINSAEFVESSENTIVSSPIEKVDIMESPPTTPDITEKSKTQATSNIPPNRIVSGIVKENYHAADNDDDDDDDEDDEDDSDSVSSAVEDALGDDDDDDTKITTTDSSEKAPTTKVGKNESSDEIDEIVDGVVETITGEQESEATSPSKISSGIKQNNTDADNDDDEDDDGIARYMRNRSWSWSRHSKDMKFRKEQ